MLDKNVPTKGGAHRLRKFSNLMNSYQNCSTKTMTSTLVPVMRMTCRHHPKIDDPWENPQVLITTVDPPRNDKKGTLRIYELGGRPSIRPFMTNLLQTANGKFHGSVALPLGSFGKCVVNRVASYKAIYYLHDMPLVSSC